MTAHLAVEAASSKLPAGWALTTFRRLAAERGTRNLQLVEQSLSLSSTGLLYERTEESDRQFASEQSARNAWVVCPGDLVVNPMWLFGGAIGVSDRRGAVSPDYRVYSLSSHLEPRFVHHLLRSSPYRDQYRLYMRAETTFDRRITKDDFNEMPLVVPPRRTQRRVADYLDGETTRIDSVVATKRTQVALLVSRTESLLADQLDPLVRKLGEVPLKSVAELRFSNVDKKSYDGESPVLLCNYTDVYYNRRIDSSIKFMEATASPDQVARLTLRAGDVLLTKDSETAEDIAVPALVTVDLPGVVLGYHLALIRARSLDGAFLYWALRSRRVRDAMSLAASGVTRYGLRQDAVGRVPIPRVDPRAASAVINEMERAVSEADGLISTLGHQIDLLLERRQGLITAAVTGQLDLHGVLT